MSRSIRALIKNSGPVRWAPVSEPPENLVTNGDFETDISGWDDAFSDATLLRDEENVIRGTASLTITAAEPGIGGAAQFPPPGADELEITPRQFIFVQVSLIADGAWQVELIFNSGADSFRISRGPVAEDAVTISGTVVSPEGAEGFVIRVSSAWDLAGVGAADTITIDDVVVVVIGSIGGN